MPLPRSDVRTLNGAAISFEVAASCIWCQARRPRARRTDGDRNAETRTKPVAGKNCRLAATKPNDIDLSARSSEGGASSVEGGRVG